MITLSEVRNWAKQSGLTVVRRNGCYRFFHHPNPSYFDGGAVATVKGAYAAWSFIIGYQAAKEAR